MIFLKGKIVLGIILLVLSLVLAEGVFGLIPDYNVTTTDSDNIYGSNDNIIHLKAALNSNLYSLFGDFGNVDV